LFWFINLKIYFFRTPALKGFLAKTAWLASSLMPFSLNFREMLESRKRAYIFLGSTLQQALWVAGK
tara:strand:+ start:296 stop:493 length:198 start_codon:yes stop_codon:yes gene_type:complete